MSRRRHRVTEGIPAVNGLVWGSLIPVHMSTHDVAGCLLTALLASKHSLKLAGSGRVRLRTGASAAAAMRKRSRVR